MKEVHAFVQTLIGEVELSAEIVEGNLDLEENAFNYKKNINAISKFKSQSLTVSIQQIITCLTSAPRQECTIVFSIRALDIGSD
jgi:hypothetical protein